jgi:competence protein ComEC
MILGGIAAITGLFIPPLGQLVAYLTWLPLTYTIHIVRLLAELPGIGISTGKVSLPVIFLFYALLFLLTIPNQILPKVSLSQKQILAGIGLLTATAMVWNMVLTRTSGYLRIVIFDDPNQGVILVQTPGGKNVLVNSGSRANAISTELNQYIPVLDRQIDMAIFSQMQKTQNQAFPVLINRFSPELFLWASPIPKNSISSQITDLLMEREINSQVWEKGAQTDLGDGVKIINEDPGEEGATLQLTYGNLRLFLIGEDIPKNLQDLPLSGGIVVLSPNDPDTQKWQNYQVLTTIHHDVYQQTGISTWDHGWIQLWSDGESLWIRTEK